MDNQITSENNGDYKCLANTCSSLDTKVIIVSKLVNINYSFKFCLGISNYGISNSYDWMVMKVIMLLNKKSICYLFTV